MATLDLSKPFSIEEEGSSGLDLSKPFDVVEEEQDTEAATFDPAQSFSVESETQESTTQEIAEGIASGLLAIPQGIGELGAAGIDYIYDTDYSTDVTDFFDGIRQAGGIDPEGTAGKIAEVAAQFVVPGLGAAGVASKLGRIANLGTLTNRAAQVGAAAVTDAVVATDGVTTLGDFFQAGPTTTEDTIGLQGREKAAARIGNRLSFALEAGGATAALPKALQAVGLLGKGVTKVATPVVAPVVRKGILPAAEAISKPIKKLAEQDNLVGDGLNSLASVFRARGNLPQDVFEVRSTITGQVEAELGEAARYLKEVQDGVDKVFKKSETIMVEGTPLTRSEVMNRLYGYMTKDPDFVRNAKDTNTSLEDMLPKFMRQPAKQMRAQVDGLSNSIKNSDYLATREADDVVNAINDNIGSYLRRKYKIFEDKTFLKSDEFAEARKEAISFFKASPKAAENLYKDLFDGPLPNDFLTGVGKSAKVSDRAAEDLVEAFVSRYSNRGRRPIKAGQEAQARIADKKLKEGLFSSRQVNNQALRNLLGEVKDPQEAYISTIADMAEFRAVDDYFKYIRTNLLDQGDNFVSAERFAQLPSTMKEGYEQLGKGFGSIEGVYVPKRIYNDMTRLTIGDSGTMGNTMRAVYSGFLKGKGVSQYTKTVLSPITQVRNVTSASLFALAQGNVGGGANLFESFGTVMGNITKRGTADRAKYYQNLQRLGVVGTQTQVREMDRLIKEGLGFTRQADADIMGIPVGQKVGNVFTRSKIGSFLSSANTKAKDMYQGGDDVWKIYNFEFEKNKIIQAYGSEDLATQALGRSVDDYAADIVKNTVPNYERVPEFVKGIRKLPVGNFIAFPAEILRTSANTLSLSLRELASDNRAVQEIGMRRLVGFTSTAVIAPAALQKMAMDLTGVSQEQMDAARESGAPWQKNSRLIPTTVDKDGNLKGYIDYSYTNPYDYLQRPALAILNAINKGEALGKDGSEVATEAVLGAVAEIFEPFAGESIITEKILDTTTRGGVTQTGSKVYREEDTPGDKAFKSFMHIADSVVPGGAPIQLKGMTKETQEPGVEVGRFARSLFMADNVDPSGNERRAGQELFRAFTGLSEIEVKPENILMYKGYEYSRGIRSASQIFNSAVSTRSTLNPENATNTFREANEARFRVMRDMYRTVQNMRQLGMSDGEIRRQMRKNKVGNISELMRGVFAPMKISPEIRRRARENDNRLPIPELNQIRNEFRGRSLVEPVQEPQVEETPTLDLEPVSQAQPVQQPQQVAATLAPPGVAQAGPTTAPSVGPASSTTTDPATLAAIIPNPRDQVLAARLRGTA
tara:strand:+ start:8931 stop:12881 length:3951 start_codon:yes stop_codon:yes gene_type:complete